MPHVVAFLAVALALGIPLSFAAIGSEGVSLRWSLRFRDVLRLVPVVVIRPRVGPA